MATWDDVARIAGALPDVAGNGREWRVNNKLFAWERPLRPADLVALGDAAPTGEILGAQVPDLGAKDALIADDPDVYFTTPHFDGYKAILVQLANISESDLTELLVEAWLARAPKRAAKEFLARRPTLD